MSRAVVLMLATRAGLFKRLSVLEDNSTEPHGVGPHDTLKLQALVMLERRKPPSMKIGGFIV